LVWRVGLPEAFGALRISPAGSPHFGYAHCHARQNGFRLTSLWGR